MTYSTAPTPDKLQAHNKHDNISMFFVFLVDKSEVVFILADLMETHEDHSVSNLQKLKTLLGGKFSYSLFYSPFKI